MKCKRCRQYLYDYVDNTLMPPQMEEIRKHLNLCPACRMVYDQERELLRDFQETAADLKGGLHFQFQLPGLSRAKTSQVESRVVSMGLKWATAAVSIVALIVSIRFLFFPPSERRPDQKPGTIVQTTQSEIQAQAGVENRDGNGIIQIISIEDDSSQLSETHFRQESVGLITDITVEVTGFHAIDHQQPRRRVVPQ